MSLQDTVMTDLHDFGSARTATPLGRSSSSIGRPHPPIVDAATIAKLKSSPEVPSPLGGRRPLRSLRSPLSSTSGPRMSSPGGRQARSPLFRQVFKNYERRSPHPVTYRKHQRSGIDEFESTSDSGPNRSSSVLRDRDDLVRAMANREERRTRRSSEFNSYLVISLERDVEAARRKYQRLRDEEFKVSNELDEYANCPFRVEGPRFLEYLVKKEQAVLASRGAQQELTVLARRLKRARISSADRESSGSPLQEIRSPRPSSPNGTISRAHFNDSYPNVLNAIRE